LYAILVCRGGDDQPWHRGKIDGGRQIALGIRQFPVYGEGNEQHDRTISCAIMKPGKDLLALYGRDPGGVGGKYFLGYREDV